MAKKNDDFKFEIIRLIGIISEGSKGWNRELNLVSWNGNEPKYDIRDWDEKHEKMGKGISVSEDELCQLKNLLDKELKH